MGLREEWWAWIDAVAENGVLIVVLMRVQIISPVGDVILVHSGVSESPFEFTLE